MDFDFRKILEVPDPYEDVALSQRSPEVPSGGLNRRQLWERRAVAFTIVLLIELGWIVWAGAAPRPELPAKFVLGAFILPLAAALLAAYASVSAGRRGLGQPVGALLSAAALSGLLFGMSALFSAPLAIQTFTVQATIACAATSTMLATLPFAAGYLLLRRTLTGCAWLRMALLGVASGCLGAMLVRLHCPRDSFPHILLGHGAAALVLGLLGTRVSRWMRI